LKARICTLATVEQEVEQLAAEIIEYGHMRRSAQFGKFQLGTNWVVKRMLGNSFRYRVSQLIDGYLKLNHVSASTYKVENQDYQRYHE
jgi:hypothetical protein